MKICKHCNHIDLIKQEIKIVRSLLCNCKTTNDIKITTGIPSKTAREVLYRLEKGGIVTRANKIKKECIDLIAKSPELFLSLFKLACEYRKLYYGQILDKSIEDMESATGRTFDQLLEIWEACAE